MNCRNTQNNLTAYVQQELDSSIICKLESHIRECHECCTSLQNVKKHLALYQNAGAFPIHDTWGQLLEKLDSPPKHKTFLWKPMRVVWTMAVALFCISIAYFYNNIPKNIYDPWNVQNISGDWNTLVTLPEIYTENTTLQVKLTEFINISLGSNTKIRLANPPHIELLSGDIFAKVTQNKPFSIQTPGGVCHIHGTIFSVHADSQQTCVKVVEGEVALEQKDQTYQIGPGEMLESCAKGTIRKDRLNMQGELPWWKDAPVAINISIERNEQSLYYMQIMLTNVTNEMITVPVKENLLPLALHVQSQEGQQIYPLTACRCIKIPDTIQLPANGQYKIAYNCTDFLKKNQDSTIYVVCNMCQTKCTQKDPHNICQELWRGACPSPPLKLLTKK